MNTAIVATAMGLLTYTVWNYSAEREVRFQPGLFLGLHGTCASTSASASTREV